MMERERSDSDEDQDDQDNSQGSGQDLGYEPEETSRPMNKWVYIPASVIIAVAAGLTISLPDQANEVLETLQEGVVEYLGWYYMLIVVGFIVFLLFVGLSRFGEIKLGEDDEEPHFPLPVWFAMLFAAAMGIGLVFFSVYEPLSHLAEPPPDVEGSPAQVAEQALPQTILHWGFHGWAILMVTGLGLSYAVHRKGHPISLRWALQPLFGDRVTGRLGDIVDTVAVVTTLFAFATALGFGVLQVAYGFEYLGIEASNDTGHIVLVIAITIVATISVVSGVDRGMKYLTNINMPLIGLIALFILITGPTVFLFQETVQAFGNYIQNIVSLSFNTTSFQPEEGQEWQAQWTTFYWGWWMAFAAATGVFVARISRGRTVREFVLGGLIAPTIVNVLWFSILGGTAIHTELFGEGGILNEDGSVPEAEAALFLLVDTLPLSTLLAIVVIVAIMLFFITTDDSASLVINMLGFGGNPEPPRWSRVFWSVLEGLAAIALLLAGGLVALQAAAIVIALPFSIIMILIVIATYIAFDRELKAVRRLERLRDRQAYRVFIEEAVEDEVDEQSGNSTRETSPGPRNSRLS